jgi:protein-tyrosine phosphatase
MPPAEYATMEVDAIVDLEDWDFAWAPPVPSGRLYLSFPIEDDDLVDPKVPLVASFVATLVSSGQRVLVHCTEGLNRSGLLVARALMEVGWDAADAIEHVRQQRGHTRDGFSALSNDRLVEWLLAERPTEADRR